MRIRVLAPNGRAPSGRDVLASILRYILETSRTEPATLRAELLASQVGRETAEEILHEVTESWGDELGRRAC